MAAVCGLLLPSVLWADVVFHRKSDLTMSVGANEARVVQTAVELFRDDYQAVFGRRVALTDKAQVVAATLGHEAAIRKIFPSRMFEKLKGRHEAFALEVKDGRLYVLGSDRRGTAYGIMELSRLIGVSPWKWWADAGVERRDSLVLEEGWSRVESPSVRYRGIFINDEDWGLMPWSSLTYEPSGVKGRIGPNTHARIFELLLRLRANTFWPAMHACSEAFYLTPGNREVADKYGIYIGTSHCEPMARNTNAEWKLAGKGEYDYVHNREQVLSFWEERVRMLKGSDVIYTLGIRGVHDGRMQGARTLPEQKTALTRILKDQRRMLARHIDPCVQRVPQVFIPYKEVLDVYRMGLEVPDDVTLMWCDDNYGYIRHFPDSLERARKGGNGVYYHLSYWGRPHDYLWLATTHPALLYTQLKTAYDHGAKDMWIFNVGDIKPAEYLIELALDMAWDIQGIEGGEGGLNEHLYRWFCREFGEDCAHDLLDVMNEYYRLAYVHKPEFMGHTRTEEKDPAYKVVSDLPWSEQEIRTRIRDYERIERKVRELSEMVEPKKQDAWFQLVEYPVCAAAAMNKKHLYGQLARHGLADWQLSDEAYEQILTLTQCYNSLNGGKWNRMMDYQPRGLPVFKHVPHTVADTSLLPFSPPVFALNGADYMHFEQEAPVAYGLGYERKAVSLPRGSSVVYEVASVPGADSLDIELCLAPNHPVDSGTLRCTIQVDDGEPQTMDIATKGRSEEWKRNVLTNQAVRQSRHRVVGKANTRIRLTALDEGIVVDQIKIYK